MVEIRWTDEAVKWLRDIYDYIAQNNTAAAAKVVSGIYDKVQLLKHFPELGHKYKSEVDCCFSVSSLWDLGPPGRRLEPEKAKIQSIVPVVVKRTCPP